MRTPIPEYLAQVIANAEDSGAVADYIPELARVNPDRFGIALCMPDGVIYSAGDADVEFSIQSASKPFAYALALEQLGQEAVEERVGVEPSGDPFNSASVEESTGRPDNPMINIGAITTHALLGPADATSRERFDLAHRGLNAFAGRELGVDEAVYTSEIKTAYRNLSLAYLVRSTGMFEQDPQEIVDGYTRQCAVSVTAKDLAVMGMTLANGGVNPLTQERVVSERAARQTLSIMSTCGMYNSSGDWMTDVGIPAKSGVGGGLFGVLPGQLGLATFSPRLDQYGNSTRGVHTFQRLSDDMGLHLMEMPPLSEAVVRTAGKIQTVRGPAHAVVLQGPLRFASVERMLRTLSEIPADQDLVVLDISRVSSVDDVGKRMVVEGIRRLRLDGHPVVLVDPDPIVPAAAHHAEKKNRPEIVASMEAL